MEPLVAEVGTIFLLQNSTDKIGKVSSSENLLCNLGCFCCSYHNSISDSISNDSVVATITALVIPFQMNLVQGRMPVALRYY